MKLLQIILLAWHTWTDTGVWTSRFSFIGSKWIMKKVKSVELVASMIVLLLLAWSFNSVRRSAAHILRMHAGSANGGCGNCIVDACRRLVSGSNLGHVNIERDEQELWQTLVCDILNKEQIQIVEDTREQNRRSAE